MALLEARGLVKRYGSRTVVKKVSLEVHPGEIVGLLGPNGAGKTTSFRMCVGMISPNAGVVRFNGKDVTRLPMYKRARLGLGYLAQDESVFRKLTVEQNLQAILELMTHRRGKRFWMGRRKRRERVAELLEKFGLTRLRKSVAMTLSGGERRRLEIARCLVSEPMLIMLDEPFTGIDPKTVGDIQTIVRGLRDDGIAILITDHHVLETLRITDRSYLLADGELLSHGTPWDIINDPKAREVYLGDQFVSEGIVAEFAHKAGAGRTPAKPPAAAAAPAVLAGPVQAQPVQAESAALPAAVPFEPASQPTADPLRQLLQRERLHELLHAPPPRDAEEARGRIKGIVALGQPVTGELLATMAQGDATQRTVAHRALCEIVELNLRFDPHGEPAQRQRDLAALRSIVDQRQAG